MNDLTAVAVFFTAGLSAAASLVNFFVSKLLVQTVYLLIMAIHLVVPKLGEGTRLASQLA